MITPDATGGDFGCKAACDSSDPSKTMVASRSGADKPLPQREHEVVPAGCASSQWGHTIPATARQAFQ